MSEELLKELKRIADSLEEIQKHLSSISHNTRDPLEEFYKSDNYQEVLNSVLNNKNIEP